MLIVTDESYRVVPVAQVLTARSEPSDDYWGGTRSVIRIDSARFGPEATRGLDEFSHLEVVFLFHLQEMVDVNLGARRPRDNPDWPLVGTFGHRNMKRINRLGVSRCRLLHVDGLDLHVEDLDAVSGTPVLDIKPWFAEFGTRGPIRQPSWPGEMLTDYYAPTRFWASLSRGWSPPRQAFRTRRAGVLSYRTLRGRNWMLMRGPTGRAVFGIACSQVRWQLPPITIRSPWPNS
jgi:tRNA (Thr-GGU) A37 N-methylase